MPRNGSGTYALPAGNPVITGTTVSSTVQNNTMSDLAAAITQSLASDGQTTPTANLPMGGFKLTNVGSGSALSDSANFGQTINQPAAITLASAATVNIGAALSSNIIISGTTTITAFDTVADGIKRDVTFSGALTLTHNATSLILPVGANITTAAGDCASFLSLGSGNWRCIKYVTASGFIRFAKGANIASAATVDLTAATGNTVHITGTTGISAWTMTSGQVMDVIFDGALTLTHHATNNNLPGAANITTATGDRARYFFDGTTVYCLSYAPAAGLMALSGNQTIAGTKTFSSPPTAKNAAKAWVSFNGTTAGTFTPPAGHNVTSITKNATGDYTITFTNALTDTNPSVSIGVAGGNSATSGVAYNGLSDIVSITTSSIRIKTFQYLGSTNTINAADYSTISVTVFGN